MNCHSMQQQLEQLEQNAGIEWQEFEVGELFDVKTTKKKFNALDVQFNGKYRYVVRSELNNGIRGYISENEDYLNDPNTISFGQDTATMFYQSEPYFTGDKIKILNPKFFKLNKNLAQIFIAAMTKAFANFSWGSSSYSVEIINQTKIQLPTLNNKIAFDFMEKFIATLNAERLATLNAYLCATDLQNYELTQVEQEALDSLDKINWKVFNLENLYGKSKRGKRLKSADRIEGTLPLVTAGEANMGISAWIGNQVEIFKKNTVTIDMFGSAKYRDYQYAADDHVAVVKTEHLSKFAGIFITSAIHKSSNAGQFDYSRNFYASDADKLNIQLPVTSDQTPDYAYMELVIKAMQKVVIKNVVEYLDQRIDATKKVIH